MKLDPAAFARARAFMREAARPLERALFARAFEGGGAAAVREALAAFRNDDGGFGRALEPDLRMPGSSVLATAKALGVLQRIEAPADDPFVSGAIGWLVRAFDPALAAWRSVPPEAEAWPHADHWKWALHADGRRWPVGVLPRAEIVAFLHAWPGCAPAALRDDQTRRLVAALEAADVSIGPDALVHCEIFARTPQAPRAARDAVAARVRALGVEMVCRDSGQWGSYVAKPRKLAPLPDSILAEPLAAEVARNLDYEIARQDADGSWAPYWSWRGAFPDVWPVAEREWRGELTLEALESLRAFARIEAL
jgi:hypothetical protein